MIEYTILIVEKEKKKSLLKYKRWKKYLKSKIMRLNISRNRKKFVGMGVAKKWIGSSGLAGARYYIESV